MVNRDYFPSNIHQLGFNFMIPIASDFKQVKTVGRIWLLTLTSVNMLKLLNKYWQKIYLLSTFLQKIHNSAIVCTYGFILMKNSYVFHLCDRAYVIQLYLNCNLKFLQRHISLRYYRDRYFFEIIDLIRVFSRNTKPWIPFITFKKY